MIKDPDVEYYRQQLAHALKYDPASVEKARKQLELIEDAVVIYKLTQNKRT
jgi:hypothetical protein